MSDLDRIARLRIALLDTEPAVWRVVEVPLTTTLRALHEVIQAAMPFQNYHLYEFQIGEHRYGIVDLDFGADLPIRDAKSIRLSRFLGEGVSAFTYVYDFGDNWQHAVTVEAVCDGEPGTTIRASSTAPAGPRPRMSVGRRGSRSSCASWPVREPVSTSAWWSGTAARSTRPRSTWRRSRPSSASWPDDARWARPLASKHGPRHNDRPQLSPGPR